MFKKPVKRIERRRGPDIWVKSIGWAKLTAWLLALSIVIILSVAKPQIETFFDRMFQVAVRKTWNYSLVQRALYMTVLLLFICISALVINSKRKRRKDDRYSISLIAFGVFSIVIIIVYLLNVL